MAIVLSTQDVHPRERLSYWRETAAAQEVDLSASPGFLATLRNQTLDNMGVSELDCDPCQVRRTSRNIARAGCDHFTLFMQQRGRGVVSQGDRVAVNQRGGFLLLDTRRPYELNNQERARTLVLTIPRRAFEERLGAAAALYALTMDAGRPLSGIVSVFLSMLPSRIEAADKPTASRLAEQALDLIALALSLEVGETATLASARATALFRLKAVIEARLCDPALKPAAVAAAAGISVRYANDLLSREGTSVERYILDRRLERSRRALEDPAQAHRMIGEIAFAWGFSDLSHFVRRFRARYGLTPGDYRRRAQEHAAADAADVDG
jgi:AraC-like DNA-binding protein